MSLSNRTTRIIVALTAIPFLLFAAYFGKWLFLLFVLFVALGAFYEFATMLKNKEIEIPLLLGEAFVFLLVFNAYSKIIEFEILILLIPLFITLYFLFRTGNSAVNNSGAALLGIFYIGLFASTLISVREYFPEKIIYERGGFLIIAVFITIWLCDSAAYFLGTAFGKHKLMPRVSPKKSWEGAISGFMFAVLGMIVMRELFLNFLGFWQALILGGLIGITGQIGDLIESLIKRDAGVKDSSALIPGHGGIFDRFDSLIFVSPFVYLFLLFYFQ